MNNIKMNTKKKIASTLKRHGFSCKFHSLRNPMKDKGYDGVMHIEDYAGKHISFPYQEKNSLTPNKLTSFINFYRSQSKSMAVVATYISSGAMETLRQEGISFATATGFIYLSNIDAYIYIAMAKMPSKRPLEYPEGMSLAMINYLKSMKVNPKLLDETYADVVKITGLSKGSISNVINTLLSQKIISKEGRVITVEKKKKLENLIKLAVEYSTAENYFNNDKRDFLAI